MRSGTLTVDKGFMVGGVVLFGLGSSNKLLSMEDAIRADFDIDILFCLTIVSHPLPRVNPGNVCVETEEISP